MSHIPEGHPHLNPWDLCYAMLYGKGIKIAHGIKVASQLILRCRDYPDYLAVLNESSLKIRKQRQKS